MTEILFNMHQMAAAFLSVPEMALDADEAAMLANGVARVERHYKLPRLVEKTKDWLNLAMVAGSIYGTRIVAYRMRVATPKPAAPRPPGPAQASAPAGNPTAPAAPPAQPAPAGPRPKVQIMPDFSAEAIARAASMTVPAAPDDKRRVAPGGVLQ